MVFGINSLSSLSNDNKRRTVHTHNTKEVPSHTTGEMKQILTPSTKNSKEITPLPNWISKETPHGRKEPNATMGKKTSQPKNFELKISELKISECNRDAHGVISGKRKSPPTPASSAVISNTPKHRIQLIPTIQISEKQSPNHITSGFSSNTQLNGKSSSTLQRHFLFSKVMATSSSTINNSRKGSSIMSDWKRKSSASIDNNSRKKTSSGAISLNEEKNVAQKASEALLVQKLLSLLRNDITTRTLLPFNNLTIAKNLSSSASPLSNEDNNDYDGAIRPKALSSPDKKWEKIAPIYEGYRKRNQCYYYQSIPTLGTSLSAGPSLCSSSDTNSTDKQIESVNQRKYLTSFLSMNNPLIPSYIEEDPAESVSFEEALEVIRNKLTDMKKKSKQKGTDPNAQLLIVRGILTLAVMAAGCSTALRPVAVDDEVITEHQDDEQESSGGNDHPPSSCRTNQTETSSSKSNFSFFFKKSSSSILSVKTPNSAYPLSNNYSDPLLEDVKCSESSTFAKMKGSGTSVRNQMLLDENNNDEESLFYNSTEMAKTLIGTKDQNEAEGQLLMVVDLTSSAEVLRAEGMRWLKRLASNGLKGRYPLPEAQNFLAILLRGHGDPRLGIKKNMERAYVLSLQASKHGSSDGCYWTAVCYEQGLGTKKDSARAVMFYRKAASQGHAKAMHRLALILQYGQLNASPSLKEAFMWLKRAAAVGTIPAALHDLALLYERGNSPAWSSIVIPDDTYSMELYKKTAAMNYAPSQVKLGTCYEYGRLGCPIDAKLSIAWYLRAAEQGHPAAELALSGWYLTGARIDQEENNDSDNEIRPHLHSEPVDEDDPNVIIPQSDVEAYAWAKRAAERKDPRAEYAIGRYCELGLGLPGPDLPSALRWYSRASLQGHRKAKKRKAELKKTLKLSAATNDGRMSRSSLHFVKFLFSGGRWGS